MYDHKFELLKELKDPALREQTIKKYLRYRTWSIFFILAWGLLLIANITKPERLNIDSCAISQLRNEYLSITCAVVWLAGSIVALCNASWSLFLARNYRDIEEGQSLKD